MDLYAAINTMRELSESRQPFSFSFMSYSRSRQTTHGIVEVRRARLKPRAKEADYAHADIIEEYVDLDTGEARKFYQPTLMTFNGQKIKLQ